MLKVLQIAQSEVGYHEQGDNFTKFAEELDRIHYFNTPKQNLAWCGQKLLHLAKSSSGSSQQERRMHIELETKYIIRT